ncbi:MAG: hypothetical protein ABJC79_11280, partial [Acidimicrobiia bacterium]
MGNVVLVLVVLAGFVGLLMGVRHLYLRFDRPHGFDCSLRLVHGEVPGLGRKFRAGYAGPEFDRLYWRRIARPGAKVRFSLDCVDLD